MSKELELKLRCVEPTQWQGLIDCIASQGAVPVAKSKDKQLINTYYDTPDLELNKRRVALRIREKDNQYIQTLKTAGTSVGGVHQRGEWEWLLLANALDESLLVELKEWPEELNSRELIPVFNTDFMRTSQDFKYKGYLFEFVLDRGKITTRQSENFELIAEVEIEFKLDIDIDIDIDIDVDVDGVATVKQGSPNHEITKTEIEHEEQGIESVVAVMKALAKQLIKDLPLALDDRSKAERGYHLFESNAE